MVRKNRDIYEFLGQSWVLITYIICPPVKYEKKKKLYINKSQYVDQCIVQDEMYAPGYI